MAGWRVLLWVAIVIAIIVFLYAVRGVLLPFLIAFALSAILDPVVRKLRLRGWSRPVAVFSVLSVFVGVTLTLAIWLGPVVGGQVSNFRQRFDELTTSVLSPKSEDNFYVRWNPVVQVTQTESSSQVDQLFDTYNGTLKRLGLPSTRREFVDKYIEKNRGELSGRISSFFSSFLGIVGVAASQLMLLLFVPLLMLLILLDMEQFKRRSATWIPPSIRASTMSILSDIGQVFMKYLRGVTISVVSYMAAMSIVLSFLGVPYAILLGVIFGAVYLIPYLNGVICFGVITLVTGLSGRTGNLFLNFESAWTFGITMAVVYLVLHFIFDSMVYPRLVGGSVGLHPVVSMFVIFSGGALFGLVGMIIAFPLAGAVKVILERLLRVTGVQTDVLPLPSVPLRHRAT